MLFIDANRSFLIGFLTLQYISVYIVPQIDLINYTSISPDFLVKMRINYNTSTLSVCGGQPEDSKQCSSPPV